MLRLLRSFFTAARLCDEHRGAPDALAHNQEMLRKLRVHPFGPSDEECTAIETDALKRLAEAREFLKKFAPQPA